MAAAAPAAQTEKKQEEESVGAEISPQVAGKPPVPSQEADEESPVQTLESLCMRCRENGTTTIYFAKIPHFREIVIMSFECPHCGEMNNEVQFAGKFELQGCLYTLQVPAGDRICLNRQVVKSETGTVKIPELDFEIPCEAQRGSLTTVEGLLTRSSEELRGLQEERRKADPDMAAKIDAFLERLDAYAGGQQPFTVMLDDPSGNSFIENPNAPEPDTQCVAHHYERSPAQNVLIGAMSEEAATEAVRAEQALLEAPQVEEGGDASRRAGQDTRKDERYVKAGTRFIPGMVAAHGMAVPHGTVGAVAGRRAMAEGNSEEVAAALFKYSAPEEVMTFPATCSACNAPSETRMYVINIPYFKEVIVMASTCDLCGYRNSEVKAGGAIPAKGKRISVQVRNDEDLKRDIIKSDTASISIPEVALELGSGTLGGKVTTVEGLVDEVIDELRKVQGFSLGDSAVQARRRQWVEFEDKLKGLMELKQEWTLIMEDPLANSFVAPVTDKVVDDKQLKVEEFERSFEQNEDLGLNDMDTAEADKAYEVQPGAESKVEES